MKVLKSLKEFENESNVMTTKELKNISGGVLRYNTTPTKGGSDRQEIVQEYIFDGTRYVPYGPTHTTGDPYPYP